MSSHDVPQPLSLANEWEGVTSHEDASETALHFSDSEDEEVEVVEEHIGDYSQQMGELFEDGEVEVQSHDGHDEGDDEEGFLYTGVDASDMSLTYHEQLRNVLGQDHEEDDSFEAHEVENSLLVEDSDKLSILEDEPLGQYREEVLSDHSPSASSAGPMTPPSRMGSPAMLGHYQKLARPFLHPTISRLRSYTPQAGLRLSQNESAATSHSHLFDGASPSPSRFSSMSRSSSISNLHARSSNGHQDSRNGKPPLQREVFRWSDLHVVTQDLYSRKLQKASSLLGAPTMSSPTVLAANGFICVGLEDGRICVYDFKQTLKAVCGSETTGNTVGSVTALALSHDHTCVASGHANGHIQLFDLKKPQTPLRTVAPTSMAVVSTGRREGHLSGSRIVSVGFIAGRHTAIVSADEHGLAFYHSLGKMLFVEASDILRILGRYPDPAANHGKSPLPLTAATTPGFSQIPRKRKVRYTVLAMAPLPLGTTPHHTDAYDVVALLTPTKLVVVGLRPTPKTWFKCPREPDEGSLLKSKLKGTLAWYPSVSRSSTSNSDTAQATTPKQILPHDVESTNPVLAYTWGNSLRLIRVLESRFKHTVRSSKTGKMAELEIGTIAYDVASRWTADDDILAIQWLNANQLIIVTTTTMGVYDALSSKLIERTKFDGLSLMSPTLSRTANGSVPYADSVTDVAHSLRVYKSKIFLLGRDRLIVGTLLTWADRILVFVQAGDFLSAIELTRTYYTGEAPGNRNGLPDDANLRKEVIGDRMRSLMDASVRYAFSEDRMTDGTHVTPDGRGVDRTALFEGLVTTCCRACVTLDDFEFLFEDLFQHYDDSGITGIYLRQLEPFILDNEIRYVPPRITQRLVALHEEDGKPEYVERIIWHMDPTCLDLNQTIHLCQKFHLYDALIYIYTRALQDYVAPIVELLGLIRRVQQYRKSRAESMEESRMAVDLDSTMEPVIMNAYKIYPYLANVLSGLSYPSEERLLESEAFQAKRDVYTFLFFGRSSVWPPGNGGKLVLTADEEGGMEPTYPYARQLLRFDSESFLHSLDIAFEDAYLNDESRSVNRLIIVRILLEILSGGQLPSEDVTFVNIFIARNVPKYPQFLQIAPTVLHNILISLAEDPDPRTQDDRQLAAEYLLSVYNPHDSENIVNLFEEAGFYRILRTWYRQDRHWPLLLATYINDPQLHASEVFLNVNEVLSLSSRSSKGSLPQGVIETVSKSLPRLLRVSIANTAILVDQYFPTLHQAALDALEEEFDSNDNGPFTYLRQLLVPSFSDHEEPFVPGPAPAPSQKLPLPLRQKFIELQSRLHPDSVIDVLRRFPDEMLDWPQVLQVCEDNEAYDAVVWTLNWKGEPQEALKKAEHFQQDLTKRIVNSLSKSKSILPPDLHNELELLEGIGLTGRDICLQHSQALSATEVPLEDLWFSLLRSQIRSVQVVATCASGENSGDTDGTLSTLRSLVQTTFEALVSVTSTQAVSFPRLFKRLVNSAPTSTGTHYTEFRIILGGMLESYRSDGDMLAITKNLIDRDLFETIARVAGERNRGWAPLSGTCNICRKVLMERVQPDSGSRTPHDISSHQIVVSRTGTIYHRSCLPLDDHIS